MLEGKAIWITRPEGQAQSLVLALEKSGAQVRSLPMLAIKALVDNEKARATVMNLDHYELLFFISTNAASLGMELIHRYWPQFPIGVDIFAVGPTTAEVLEKYDLKAEFPVERMSSEALLALESLANVAGKKALIVRGVGGRELLATALRERGVRVDYLELYQRSCPAYQAGELTQYFRADSPAAVVVSSSEALSNLADLLAREQLAPGSVPLFVSSERIAQEAAVHGFVHTIVMSGANDKAIIQSLEENLNHPEH